MWLTWLLVIVFLFALIAGILAGGIFTIVLVPLAILAFLVAIAVSAVGRLGGVDRPQQTGSVESGPGPGGSKLPRRHGGGGGGPSTPEELADARRQA